jgi:hypothetical protein
VSAVIATTAYVAVCDDAECGGWISAPQLERADAEWEADHHDQQVHDR